MFAGHVGAALAIGRFERRLNVGWLVSAALLLDLILWVLVLLGVEAVEIPASFGRDHQAAFVFPYSHGLLAALLWALLATSLALLNRRRGPQHRRVALLIGAAVLSHWLLDALVHRPELPFAGRGSAPVGLALWDHMPLALLAEALVLLAGLALFARGSLLARRRLLPLALLSLALLALTVTGLTVAPPPPSAFAMAASSLMTLVLVCGLYGWLGRAAAPNAWNH
jgi:hypothetical protein